MAGQLEGVVYLRAILRGLGHEQVATTEAHRRETLLRSGPSPRRHHGTSEVCGDAQRGSCPHEKPTRTGLVVASTESKAFFLSLGVTEPTAVACAEARTGCEGSTPDRGRDTDDCGDRARDHVT
eukprot:1704071-Rhodomonas_salina.1